MAPATDSGMPCYAERASNYKVMSFAVDLTGKKLIDEICHLTACQGEQTLYDQYIMPYRDVSRSSTRTHGIRIYTLLGKYRVLKDLNTMKSLHTKSEYSAIHDFIQWLKEMKGESQGIILAFHDVTSNKATPFLMEALDRYNMTDEFFDVVKGFVNCCTLAAAHPDLQGKSLSLYSLARRLLNEDTDLKREDNSTEDEAKKSEAETTETETKTEKREDSKDESAETDKDSKDGKKRRVRFRGRGFVRDKEREHINIIHSSKYRALTTYKLIHKFVMSPETSLTDEELLKFVSGKEKEIELMHQQRELAVKVRSLRPIFAPHIRQGFKERSRAVLLRRYLIDAAVDYNTLKQAYEENGRDGVVRIVEETSAKKKPQNQEELIEMIHNHFKSPDKDVNENLVKGEKGAGDRGNDHESTSESDSDDEYEEAKE